MRKNVWSIYLNRRNTWKTETRWKDETKMYIKRVGCKGEDWINLAQDGEKRGDFVNAVINNRLSSA
jgi:hypothetical protein